MATDKKCRGYPDLPADEHLKNPSFAAKKNITHNLLKILHCKSASPAGRFQSHSKGLMVVPVLVIEWLWNLQELSAEPFG
jgi:hypothetical protein